MHLVSILCMVSDECTACMQWWVNALCTQTVPYRYCTVAHTVLYYTCWLLQHKWVQLLQLAYSNSVYCVSVWWQCDIRCKSGRPRSGFLNLQLPYLEPGWHSPSSVCNHGNLVPKCHVILNYFSQLLLLWLVLWGHMGIIQCDISVYNNSPWGVQ